MRWSEVIKKLKRLKYKEGVKKNHYTVWNCPCANQYHPVGVGNHIHEECRFEGLKRQLGPHIVEFGKI